MLLISELCRKVKYGTENILSQYHFKMIVGFSEAVYITLFSKHLPILECLDDNYSSCLLLLVSMQYHCLLLVSYVYRGDFEIIVI